MEAVPSFPLFRHVGRTRILGILQKMKLSLFLELDNSAVAVLSVARLRERILLKLHRQGIPIPYLCSVRPHLANMVGFPSE